MKKFTLEPYEFQRRRYQRGEDGAWIATVRPAIRPDPDAHTRFPEWAELVFGRLLPIATSVLVVVLLLVALAHSAVPGAR